MADAVLRDVRCVLQGSIFEHTLLGTSPQSGRCVVRRTLCSSGSYALKGSIFSNRHSYGHLFVADAVLWDARCVPDGSILNRHSLGHLLTADAVLWDVRCVLEGSIC